MLLSLKHFCHFTVFSASSILSICQVTILKYLFLEKNKVKFSNKF